MAAEVANQSASFLSHQSINASCSPDTARPLTLQASENETSSSVLSLAASNATAPHLTCSNSTTTLTIESITQSAIRSPYVLAMTVFLLLVPTTIYLYCDYQAFLALGRGGTPSTIRGYLRVKLLSLLALKNQYTFESSANEQHAPPGQLTSLPDRGIRPVTRGIAPHRQMTQRASNDLYQKLAQAVDGLGVASLGMRLGTSCFEKHSTGLFSLSPIAVTCEGEICHVHPSDGSMHLTLHPSDARLVLQSRWGERHPLARNDRRAYFVPQTFLMVYAPRSEADIEVLIGIVKAAAWFVGGYGGIQDGSACQELVDEQ